MTARTATALLAALSAFLLHAAAAPCRARATPGANASGVKLAVQVGWGDKVRAGRWTPVFVETKGARTQAAVVEVYSQQGGADAMLVRQFLTIGPVPTTVTLYVPVQFNGDQGPTVLLRDEATGKTLAHDPPDVGDDGFSRRIVNGGSPFVGVSGQPTVLQALVDALPSARVETGYLGPDLLPASTVGYEGLDVLVLNRPDLLHLPGAQQRAIVDWVLSGGNLILWPGDDPAPRTGPLVEALPCRIGGGRNATIVEAELHRLGLPKRFADVRGRRLEPVPAGAAGASGGPPSRPAEAIPLFAPDNGPDNDPDNFAYRRQLGLGRILVAPVDLSELRFDDPASAARFWEPLLAGMSVLPHEPGDAPQLAAFPRYNADQDVRRRYAAGRVLEHFFVSQDEQPGVQEAWGKTGGAGDAGDAGDAGGEGSGSSDFMLVLLGAMAVAGPADGLVLRCLGRRPWTWVTTTASLILLVGGAGYLMRQFKSRRLSYQTVRVLDQIDGGTVAETSLVYLDPPHAGDYHLTAAPEAPSRAGATTSPADGPNETTGGAAPPAPPALPAPGWWAVVATDADGSRRGMIHDVPFHQTDRGNAPDPMPLKAGELRFLRQESAGGGPALLEASLSVVPGPSPVIHVKGVVRNVSAQPLTQVRVRTKRGATPPIDRIEPNGSAAIDADVDAGSAAPFSESEPDPSIRYARDRSAIDASELWQVAGDLAGSRSRRIDDLLDTGRYACVYAETANAVPPAALREAGDVGAARKHYELVRAVVPVNAEGEKR